MKYKIKKYIKVIVLTIAVIVVAYFVYLLFFHSNSDRAYTPYNLDNEAATTSSAPTAQEDFSDGTEREPGNSLNENAGTGLITDTGGQNIDESGIGNFSEDGKITVYSPQVNSSVVSGSILSGKSSLKSVQYRIIDNVSGVIGLGQLPVVSGSFSGTFSFNTSATEGRIDIFATNPDGSEHSNVEIPVRLTSD